MNIFSANEANSTRLNLRNPALNLTLPFCVRCEIWFPLQRFKKFVYQASTILGRQSLGLSGQFLN